MSYLMYHYVAPFLGLARTVNVQCTYNILGREVTQFTVIYGVYRYTVLADPSLLL